MKISCCSLVGLVLTIFGLHGYSNAYLGCPKPNPCIYYTDKSAIKAIDVNASRYPDTRQYTVVNAPGSYAIDIDMTADMIYWSEHSPTWKIRRMNLNNGSTQDLIIDLGEVEGIAVDWINRNLYWTDIMFERIEVSTLDGLYRKTLINKTDLSAGIKILHNPKAIAVHPTKGYLFWTDYHYYYPQLARSTLAGTEYRMLRDLYYASQYKPAGLTIDYTQNRLYFIDAYQSAIESFDLNGQDRQKHHTAGHSPYPNDMTFLGNMIYWADSKSHSIERVNRTSWLRELSYGWLGDQAVEGLVGYDSSYQKPANTSCTNNNGQCSHLCLPKPSGRICACPNGVKLLSNNLNCSTITTIVPPPTPPAVEVKLVGGRFPSEGRVEVIYVGNQGTVCDDYFGLKEANVICRMLNYSRALAVYKRSHFGNGQEYQVIWLDSVKCRGNEKSISECQHAGWGVNDCTHFEDVGVGCDNGTLPGNVSSPYYNNTGLKVRLQGGLEDYEGRVEVYYQNEWGTICDPRWTLQDARVVCRMLGYEDAWDAQGDAYFGQGTSKVMVSDVACTGDESSIGLCYSSGWGNPTCSHGQDVSVTCKEHPSKISDSRIIRLRDGLTANEGRVEIKHNGKWGTICDDLWDIRDAQVVCRQLGYPGAFSALGVAAFGPGSGSILLSLFGCNGNENSWEQCSHAEWGAAYCVHSEDASVICKTNNTMDPKQDSSSFLLVADQKRQFLRQIINQSDNANHRSYPYVIQNSNSPDFVAIDPVARTVYVTDSGNIYMSRLFQNDSTLVISQGPRISGLAVDHVCKKLYWSNFDGNMIMVSNLDGSSARGLLTVDSPKGIALDIRGGVMYYIGGFPNAKIYRCHMDGSNNKTLLTLTSSPTSIAHDSTNNILYWTDADKILYLNLTSNAMSAQLLSSVHVSRPYGLVVHAGYLYWTDLKSGGFTGGLYRARLTSGASHVTELVLSGLMTPRGVASLDATNALPESLACNDCQCQQMCLRVPTGHQCVCSGIYRLNSDNSTCGLVNFFAYVDGHKETAEFVRADASHGNKKVVSIPLKKGGFPWAIEWDAVEHRIYYGDISKFHIARVYMNGSSEEVILTNVLEPKGLAIDHVGRNLYFTDFSSQTVSVSKLDGTYKKTLISTTGNKPSCIAVYSETGYLYFGTWGTKAKIHRALMDGTEHTVLLEWSGTFSSYGPSQMTIDKRDNRLYWVGWHDSYIEYLNLNNTFAPKGQLAGYSSYLWLPGGITLSPSRLCWTDQQKEGLFCGNRNGTLSAQTLISGVRGIKGLQYCKAVPQPPSAHPCAGQNNGDCTHLCLLKPNGHSCACPDVIAPGTTCSIPTTSPPPTTTLPPTTTTPPPTTLPPTTLPPTTTTLPPTTTRPPPTTTPPPTQPPTTTKPTTTSPPITSPLSTAATTTPSEDKCMSNPCQNGGTCKLTGDSYECDCPVFFVPKSSCENNIEDDAVTITVDRLTRGQAENLLRELIAWLVEILNQRASAGARVRRAVENRGNITAENIYIGISPNQEGNQIDFQVAVVYPSANGTISSMPSSTLQQSITDSEEQLNQKLQSRFSDAKISKVEVAKSKGRTSGRTSKTSKGTIAGVVVVVLLLILIAIALLIYFSRKRNRATLSKDKNDTETNDYATFSNPGYGIEQPGTLAPPLTDSTASGTTNPTYEMMDNPVIQYKEKGEPNDFTSENQYSEIPPARKNLEPHYALPSDTNADPNQYQGLSWERFDEPSEQEDFSGGTLTMKMDQGDDEATA